MTVQVKWKRDEKLAFWTNNSVYLGKIQNLAIVYNERLIGTRLRLLEVILSNVVNYKQVATFENGTR